MFFGFLFSVIDIYFCYCQCSNWIFVFCAGLDYSFNPVVKNLKTYTNIFSRVLMNVVYSNCFVLHLLSNIKISYSMYID